MAERRIEAEFGRAILATVLAVEYNMLSFNESYAHVYGDLGPPSTTIPSPIARI